MFFLVLISALMMIGGGGFILRAICGIRSPEYFRCYPFSSTFELLVGILLLGCGIIQLYEGDFASQLLVNFLISHRYIAT